MPYNRGYLLKKLYPVENLEEIDLIVEELILCFQGASFLILDRMTLYVYLKYSNLLIFFY